ncbi:MAG: efflux RND transporter permease subunit [Candidatus Omnitrophica bacterium]|nr:efflux RND transporter permease subunit [Candidatus Omnitrophota bacterium]MBU0878399.1 efflux RND transporter permease subunit [Candidatus Omnitrophota bacterium]MBU0896879.1 efflux RND transporter permease subunit [Candidatus Omnitrophota bacterium]MBU1810246.1 efflux RND transporter permease subunit [Candidatus Omnitrophota bacterium]
MKISEFSVKHSLLVNLISVFILIAGFYTLYVYKIRREAFPDVSFDMVTIATAYPGAASGEIEKLVTVPLEKELKGVEGIEKMHSASMENISTILIKISQDVKDKRKVVSDIQQAVDQAKDLPKESEDPMVMEITSGEIPIIEVALSGDLEEVQLQGDAQNLEDILENISGVSSIVRRGFRDREVWVEVNPDKMKDYHLSLQEVASALEKRNVAIPAGKLYGEQEFSIRTTGEFYTKPEIESVIIRANEAGNWLRIKDVAKVRFSFKDEDIINKSRGSRSINLTVIKRASGDAVKIVDEVKKETNNFIRQAKPELKVSYINDISFYIKRRLGVLKNNGIIGLFLVCLVLMIFLNFRVAVLTALGIPIAFCTTLGIMGFFGLSINLITMFGLIIVLGMLVDDGIIVAENCSRYLENGLDARQAAVVGTQEVVKPVTATILTTIAAFSPLMFMKGMMGKFIWGIPLVVIIALLASLFEALIILPSHFADFVRIKKEKLKSSKERHWFKKLVEVYTRLVTWALNSRYWVILVVAVVLIFTFILAKNMSFVLFGSEEGIEQFYIRTEAPVGTNLYITDKLVSQIEEKVKQLPKNELDVYTAQIGTIGQSWMFDPYGASGSHLAQVAVYLKPAAERKKKVNEIIGGLRKKIKDVKGFDKIYFEKEKEGPPIGKAVAVKVRGEDFAILEQISAQIIKSLKNMSGVSDITSDYQRARGEIRVVVDEEEAARAFLSSGEIASSIRFAFYGAVATSIKPTKAEEEIDVIVRFPQEYRNKKESFEKILIPNKFGNLIPLNKVAHIKERKSPGCIRHLGGRRIITVRAEVDNKNITSYRANQLLAKEFKNVSIKFPGYSIEYGGEQEENIKSMKSFIQAFVLAFFLIFLILAANFNSLIQPLVVMMAIPLGLIGVVWAFFFHGLPLSFFMMMGIVGLCGIVVNNSIVLVEFINNLRRKGIERRTSIIEGGRLRLRPVLLTTITTALGLTPTAYGIGGGDPFLKPMALTIVWGIICATVLTLIVLPCLYAIIDDITLKITGHATVRKDNNKEKCPEKGKT